MIEKIAKLVEVLTKENIPCLIGDDTLFNVNAKNIDKVQALIYFPSSTISGIAADEVVAVKMQLLAPSEVNQSLARELNVLQRCDDAFNSVVRRALLCELGVMSYRKEVVMMQYDALLSGFVITFEL